MYVADEDPGSENEPAAKSAWIYVCDECCGEKSAAHSEMLQRQFEKGTDGTDVGLAMTDCLSICKGGSVKVKVEDDVWKFAHIDRPRDVRRVVKLARGGRMTPGLRRKLF